jgi:hypothetical protein
VCEIGQVPIWSSDLKLLPNIEQIHDNNEKRNLLINAEKPEVEMPVVWLLRYANRTSNLKTVLTRKYRILLLSICNYE